MSVKHPTATTQGGVKRHAAARRKSGASRSLLIPVEPFKGTSPLRAAYLGAVDLAAHLGQAIKQQNYWKRRALRAEGLLRRVPKVLEGHLDMTAEEVMELIQGDAASKDAQADDDARAHAAIKLLDTLWLHPHYELRYRNLSAVLTALDYLAPEAAARLREEGYEAAGEVRRALFPDPEDEEA